MKLDSLRKLFIHELKDLYSAESQLIDALPKMVKAARDEQLKAAFQHHLNETKTHRAIDWCRYLKDWNTALRVIDARRWKGCLKRGKVY